jgi:hypothetical protein
MRLETLINPAVQTTAAVIGESIIAIKSSPYFLISKCPQTPIQKHFLPETLP